jgi:hypothetical protein
MEIHHKEDLRLAYGLLEIAKKDNNLSDFVKNLKHDIRKYLSKPDNGERLIKDDGIDGCIVLTPLPEDINELSAAGEWFRNNEYISKRYSAYDCTGEMFTQWFKIFERNGRFYAYHSIGLDI